MIARHGIRETVQPMAEMPTRIPPRTELAGEITLLRQIVELQERVIALTLENADLHSRVGMHAWEDGYLHCLQCDCWLPAAAFARNGPRTGRGRWRPRCRVCDKTTRCDTTRDAREAYNEHVGSSDAPHANIASTPFGSLTLSNGVAASRGQAR